MVGILESESLNFSIFFFFLKRFLKLPVVFFKCTQKSYGSGSFLTSKVNKAIKYLQFC